jgi:L-amino acid N-acyltransferase YncA
MTNPRHAIRHLLDPHKPADARAAYYAFDHPAQRTTLHTDPPDAARAGGYLCLSRTGLDLFRPLLTLRLPLHDPERSAALLRRELPPGMPLFLNAPLSHAPLIEAFFTLESREEQVWYVLEPARFEPVINVLVSLEQSADHRPRATIRRDGTVMAAATVNWQSARYAEIGVETRSEERRQGWGRSVVAALCARLLETGRTPIYAVSADNAPSRQLARAAGFRDSGAHDLFAAALFSPPDFLAGTGTDPNSE